MGIKRAIGLIAVAVAALFVVMPEAEAQRGEKTLGIAGGYATYNSGGYANLFFQYTFASHVRIAPEVGYIFRNEGKSGFEMSVDMHFPFRIARGFGAYPLAGVTFNSWKYSGAGSANRVGLDFGAGFDIYLTTNLKLNVQGKYSLMNDTDGGFIDVGIGYVF